MLSAATSALTPNGTGISKKEKKFHACTDTEVYLAVGQTLSLVDVVYSLFEFQLNNCMAYIQKLKAILCLKSDAVPRFHKPRSVPFAKGSCWQGTG